MAKIVACPGCAGAFDWDMLVARGTGCPHCGHPLSMKQVVSEGHDQATAERVAVLTGEPLPKFRQHSTTGIPMAYAHGEPAGKKATNA
jgi:hypothetical protein